MCVIHNNVPITLYAAYLAWFIVSLVSHYAPQILTGLSPTGWCNESMRKRAGEWSSATSTPD